MRAGHRLGGGVGVFSSGIVWSGKIGGLELLSASGHTHTFRIFAWEAFRSKLLKELLSTGTGIFYGRFDA